MKCTHPKEEFLPRMSYTQSTLGGVCEMHTSQGGVPPKDVLHTPLRAVLVLLGRKTPLGAFLGRSIGLSYIGDWKFLLGLKPLRSTLSGMCVCVCVGVCVWGGSGCVWVSVCNPPGCQRKIYIL